MLLKIEKVEQPLLNVIAREDPTEGLAILKSNFEGDYDETNQSRRYHLSAKVTCPRKAHSYQQCENYH